MATISSESPVFTVMIDFTLEGGAQGELIRLVESIAEVSSRQRGFISASVHRSVDGRRVFNYAQWKSRADYEKYLLSPELQERGRELQQFMERNSAQLNWNFYQVVSCFEAQAPVQRPLQSNE